MGLLKSDVYIFTKLKMKPNTILFREQNYSRNSIMLDRGIYIISLVGASGGSGGDTNNAKNQNSGHNTGIQKLMITVQIETPITLNYYLGQRGNDADNSKQTGLRGADGGGGGGCSIITFP